MKTFKTELVNAIVKEAEGKKIVSLQETAKVAGVSHIKRQDVQDIASAVLKALPEYKAVQMVGSEGSGESLFCSLCFMEKDVEFEEFNPAEE